MYQLDLFKSTSDDFLYSEIQKVRTSMDKRSRAIFALLNELQDQVLKIQEKKDKK